MKFNLIVLAGATTVLVSACSFTPKEQAEGKFDYTKLHTDAQIKPAPNKTLPELSNRYAIPEAETKSPIGKEVPVLAPKLVWPVANGSRVEEDETRIRVFFDELEGMSNVEHYVWQGVLQAAKVRGIAISEQVEKKFILTDWLAESFQYGDDDQNVVIRRKIEVVLDTAEHGRTTALISSVAEREVTADVNLDKNYLEHLDRNAASLLLNGLISEIAITQNRGVASMDDDGAVVINSGFDEDGYASILVSASFSFGWSVMQDVLPQLGFEINDRNRETGRYYTTYSSESGASVLAFWRDREAGQLDIPNGEYEIKVTGDRNQTSLTWFRNGEPLSAAEVTRIFAPVAAEIRKQSGV